MTEVKKLDLASITPKLGIFLLFNKFLNLADFLFFHFLDLDNFWNLDKSWLFDFANFLVIFISPPTSNPITLLLPFFILGLDTLDNSIVFSIEENRTAILLKP